MTAKVGSSAETPFIGISGKKFYFKCLYKKIWNLSFQLALHVTLATTSYIPMTYDVTIPSYTMLQRYTHAIRPGKPFLTSFRYWVEGMNLFPSRVERRFGGRDALRVSEGGA